MNNKVGFSKHDYYNLLYKAKKKIAIGGEKNYKEAQEILDGLENWRPMRVEYICVSVELMLARGMNKKVCRNILDTLITEKYYQPVLAEVYRIRQLTFEKNTMEWEMCDFSRGLYSNNKKVCNNYIHKLEFYKNKILNNVDDIIIDDIKKMGELYYITRNMVMYYVSMLCWCRINNKIFSYKKYITEEFGLGITGVNLHYLVKQFKDTNDHVYVIIKYGGNDDFDILATILKISGYKVVVLRDIIDYNEYISASEAVKYSIDNSKVDNGFIIINPLRFRLYKEDICQDNVADLLIFLANNIEQKGEMVFFVNDDNIDKLLKNNNIAKHVQKMSGVLPSHFLNQIAYGWAGDYLRYMGYVYGEDIDKKINSPAECDFSIVIPVRNNADALKYTLRTCLQVEYDGKYEIVVSDNSDPDETSIEELCNSFRDEKIKYYRTPFFLPLPKAFEFAYIQARGEFILSIGADDGIFPWTLTVLKKLQGCMGECEIIQWERGFYAWPGFNYGQQNCLSISYPKAPLNIEYTIKSGQEILRNTINNADGKIYKLPLLYINSGFKRSYLKTLLEKTGRLLDTSSQDVPIGTLNLVINKNILYTEVPLSIAGMMEKSIGYQSIHVYDSLQEFSLNTKKTQCSYLLAEYAPWGLENKIPMVSIDIILFYHTFMKAIAIKLLDETESNRIDWESLYIRLIDGVLVEDIAFEYYMSEIRYSASKCGSEISSLVENLYEQRTEPVLIGKPVYRKDRAYSRGIFREKNMLIIDGAEFNIKNIEDAVQFLSKLLHICDTN